MNFEHINEDNGQDGSQEPMPRQAPKPQQPVREVYLRAEPPVAKKSGWRFFWRILFALSVLTNIFLFLVLVAASLTMVVGQTGMLTESLVRDGAKDKKIVVIRLEGVITNETSVSFTEQLNAVREDPSVRAVIVRTITPGGSVSASDQIHHEISKFRDETRMPVVAFMQSVAASGGYYTSVACNSIVAEPTVITGSIGVI
ncbi:MAG: S49 family peptidase, partial [Anaerohalosphaera sp.]|nr:S49 family peptidase [Anaerohalosphaera sp.]